MRKLIRSYEYGAIPNSHDILKCVALAAMVIDHLGYYLFPEALWMRAVGRMAFPLFLFLVGYNGAWRFDRWLLGCALVVLASHAFNGVPMLPLNILFAILLWRLMMGFLEKRPQVLNDLFMLWVAMLVFHVILQFVVEYGTLGLMFAVLGWHHRQGRNDRPIRIAWLFTLSVFVALQTLSFGFSGGLLAYVITQTFIMGLLLMQFRPREFPLPRGHAAPSPTWQEALVILSSRNTLLLYVLHVVAFQIMAHMLYPERHSELFLLMR